MSTYADYVSNDALQERYAAYQERYAEEPRESDKVLAWLLGGEARAGVAPAGTPLLDIGCSTGNLLRYLSGRLPWLLLSGADLSEAQIEKCIGGEGLADMVFSVMDITDIRGEYNYIVANAVLYLLAEDEFDRALESVARALPRGGHFLAFDFFHPYDEEIEVVERSRTHPEGLTLRMRSYDRVRVAFEQAGFEKPEFHPFEIPIDLSGEPVSDNADGFEDLNTRTILTADGRRLLFRGTLYQPWCHLVARKGT